MRRLVRGEDLAEQNRLSRNGSRRRRQVIAFHATVINVANRPQDNNRIENESAKQTEPRPNETRLCLLILGAETIHGGVW